MSNSFGKNITYTIFGESHAAGIGITIDGLPAGFEIDFDVIDQALSLRSGQASYNTPRKESNDYQIICGYFNNKTTGSPLTIVFRNTNTKSKDYDFVKDTPRPGHVDYPASIKYHNHHDYRGGGAFSGRLTTPIVFAGYLIKQLVKQKYPDLKVVTHISEVNDNKYADYYQIRLEVVNQLMKEYSITEVSELPVEKQKEFALALTKQIQKKLIFKQPNLQLDNDSVGGYLQTIITNPPVGFGAPFFNSIESTIAQLLYSIPSIKSVSFGNTKQLSKLGSNAKDEYLYLSDRAYTLMNNNGGILGGLSTGEDIVFTSLIKPISSIPQMQATYSYSKKGLTNLSIKGRHDLSIINRIIPIINSMTYLSLYEMILDEHN